MKVLGKIKKIFLSIGAFILLLPSKIFAAVPVDINKSRREILYGVPQPAYGVPNAETSWIEIIWSILRVCIIPIALIIGVIVYLKKSKESKKRKAITVVALVAVTGLVCFVINYVINYLELHS